MIEFACELTAYSVQWSPYDESRLAVSTAQNFGIIGSGQQLVLDVPAGGAAS